MKDIILLGDLHFGARGDSEYFAEYFLEFFDNIFFPYLIDNKIKVVFQFGDIVDRRKIINIKTMKMIQERFLKKFKEYDIKLIVFLGNHDTYHKNTNEVNALNVLFDGYDNVTIIEKPTSLKLGKKTIDIIPWINKENYDESMSFIERSTSDYAFGHFEFSGFEFQVGIQSHGGMSIKPFKHYSSVYSGHYHHHSEKGNITYIGTPYEITWADFDDNKGFMALNVETGKCKFIQNHNKMFHKIKYESEQRIKENFNNKIIKVYNKEKHDVKFDDFIRSINDMNPQSVTVIDSSVFSKEDILGENIEIEDTHSIIMKTLDEIEGVDKEKIKRLATKIYDEAMSI